MKSGESGSISFLSTAAKFPAALDLLRSFRETPEHPEVILLAATALAVAPSDGDSELAVNAHGGDATVLAEGESRRGVRRTDDHRRRKDDAERVLADPSA